MQNIASEIQRRMRYASMPLLGMLLLVYFGYHAVNGERGIRRYYALKKEIAETQKIALKYKQERQSLEKEVKLLSPESLDLDLLEERSRAVLNMGKSNEVVILYDENK